MPKVTVIIAAYNCSHTLKCALESLCGQTYTDFEAWVVGDCCTDDSEQVVAGILDPRLHWTNLSCRIGSQSGPNNEGLRRAQGEYIAYLGQDDLWFPWHLASLVATMEQTKSDFVHAAVVLVDPSRPPQAIGGPMEKHFYANRFVPPSAWLHRRGLVETCGPWPNPQGLPAGVDFVFLRRACLAGASFAGSSQVSVIKFPSPWWKIYDLRDNHPQPQYLARIQQAPVQLLNELLTELAIVTTKSSEELRIRPALRTALRAIYLRVLDGYGRDRWPLQQWLIWRQNRRRKRLVVLRGLSSQPASGKREDRTRQS